MSTSGGACDARAGLMRCFYRLKSTCLTCGFILILSASTAEIPRDTTHAHGWSFYLAHSAINGVFGHP